MYNKVILVGNLTRDIEIRYSKDGLTISSVGIATNRKWKAKNGEQKEEVMFIDLTFFGKTAEIAHQYLKKGSKILVEGRLVFQQWTGQDGSKKSKHNITVDNLQMLGEKNNSANSNYSDNTYSNNNNNNNKYSSNENSNMNINKNSSIDSDEIPF